VGMTRANAAVAPSFPRGQTLLFPRSGARSIAEGSGSPHPDSDQSQDFSLDRTLDREQREEAAGQGVLSIDDRSADPGKEDSVFRWALSSVAHRMGCTLPAPSVAVGSGAFAVAPPQSFISLPVSASIVKSMDGINHTLAKKVDTGRSDGFFPPLVVTSDAQRVYASQPTGPLDLVCQAPTEDPLLALLRRQDKTVWSAYVKKQRLAQWQTAVHQMTGRLSMMDSVSLFMQDLINESSMVADERDQLQGALSVMQSALRGTGTLSTSLSAHLDLTVRDAELRQLDLTPFQMSQFRSSPLFRERLFGITKADVEEITSSRMVSDIHSLASKGGPRASSSSAPKQGKKTQSKGATQPSRLAPPFPGQAAVPRQGQQPSGQKRGGERRVRRRVKLERDDSLQTPQAVREEVRPVARPRIPQPGPVGGRLQGFVEAWSQISEDPWVVEVIRYGLTLSWLVKPSLTREPWFFQPPKHEEKFERLRLEISQLLANRSIEEVAPDTPAWYSLVFLVPKKTGGFRPVFDLSGLNRHLVIPRFHMESALTIMSSLKQGDWVVSIDIKDAYLHVPIHPEFRKYLHLAFLGKVYRFRVLPFGVATAPYVFTRLVSAMAAAIRLRGVKFHHYLDDWLIVGDSVQQVQRSARIVLELAVRLGWIPNWEKSCLTPTQCLVHVGIEYDLEKGLAFPPESRLSKLDSLATTLLACHKCSARQMLSLIGLLASMEKQVPFGRCFLRPLQWGLALQWSIMTEHLDRQVQMRLSMKEALRWWLDRSNTRRGRPLEQFVPDQLLFTDASMIAWGAHLNDWRVSRRWEPLETTLHINLLELRAVKYAYEMWGSHFGPGTKWLVFSDNTTVVAYLNKQGGTKSLSLCLEAEEVIRRVYRRNHILRARHIPGKRNVWADQLSRPTRILGTEWSLCTQVFKRIGECFFVPQIDLFATSVNHKCPVFYSPLPESTSLGTDAMSHPWDGIWAYAYPPTGFILEVLRKVQRSTCEILLVAPAWPRQAWYPLLLSLLVDDPRSLPCKQKLLKQPNTSFFHLNPDMLRLHVWRLSNDPSRRRVFLNRCQVTSREETELPPTRFMKPNGEYSNVGVSEGRWIRARPL